MTAGQALHWFDADAFAREAKRILRPGGVLAAFGYKYSRVTPDVDALVRHHLERALGPYWPPEHLLVNDAYRAIALPINESCRRHSSCARTGRSTSTSDSSGPGRALGDSGRARRGVDPGIRACAGRGVAGRVAPCRAVGAFRARRRNSLSGSRLRLAAAVRILTEFTDPTACHSDADQVCAPPVKALRSSCSRLR